MSYSSPLRVQLQHKHTSFTNLDEVSGRVFLSLVSQETIAGITVKLEGESRTRLAGSTLPGSYDPYSRDQTQLEVHKLLYKVATVFPSQDIAARTSSRNQYTLPPGQYEYPFKFKIPFNNDCIANSSVLANLSTMSALRLDTMQGIPAHVKKTLPPTLGGLPGQAEISYFIKATVQRPAFYKENWRYNVNFLFFPIEPPRPPPNRRESFARVQHQFAPPSIASPEKSNNPFRKSSASWSSAGRSPPSISIEGRLPDPAIITCNEALPLRILVKKLNSSDATIYLQMLQIELVAFTTIRAHQLRRNEMSSWVILSSSNMRMPLEEADSTAAIPIEIPSTLWKQRPLPNNVSPTFTTCNIVRTYRLLLKVGLSWGSAGNIHPEMSIQLLRMPVEVYSGIAPPQALLNAMSNLPSSQTSTQPNQPPPTPVRPGAASNSGLPGYSQAPPPASAAHGASDHIEPSPGDIPPDAPPSYEDAIADDMGPIDGARRDYQQATNQVAPDEKGRGRLFTDGAS